ncbi:MAG: hypothetical protein HETSPECPRED_007124 [Heterodermia speciosa]|uniref:Cytochrome b5 heme-binding domain-containing protein n=1 Tax=Heterodermia speciosa TaxID=116794 RepID=A0A8H3EHW3_9LECA|nr:MAG: hypothetical protein HETSPECPRED_007124 [Heterodermia speciosa]
MSETKELTYSDVAEHSSKKDLYLVVHDKVYNATEFVDEHPGGEEVLMDVGGQDATEAFEDVGHSDEAREILDKLLVGDLKRVAGDPAPKSEPPKPTAGTTTQDSTGFGIGIYALVLLGGALAFGAYKYLQLQSTEQK